jgi:Spy/CpxP family protein refolding chaperone
MKDKTIATSRVRVGAAVVLAAALCIPSLAWSGGGRGPFGPMGGDMFRMERMMDELGLDDTQRAEMKRIMEEGRTAMQPLVKNMVAGHRAMRELIDAEVLDEAAVRALAESQNDARVEMMVLQARNRHAIRRVLTPEQREQLDSRHRRHGGHDG